MPNKKEDTKTKQTKKDNKKKNNKSESGAKKWFKDYRAELKKIIWPSKKQLWENTAVVISMVVIVSVIIVLLDLGFKALNGLEVKGAESIKNRISSSENETTDNAIDTNSLTVTNSTDNSATAINITDNEN